MDTMREDPRDTFTAGGWFVLSLIVGAITGAVLLAVQQHDDNGLSFPKKPSSHSWPVDHPVVVGLIVFAAILIIGRLYLFMRRIEDHNRT